MNTDKPTLTKLVENELWSNVNEFYSVRMTMLNEGTIDFRFIGTDDRLQESIKIGPEFYKTLQEMDESAANGAPIALNRAVGYSKDNLYGVLWEATLLNFGDGGQTGRKVPLSLKPWSWERRRGRAPGGRIWGDWPGLSEHMAFPPLLGAPPHL